MRTLIVTEFITLDGIVDSPGGGDHPEAGWTFRAVDHDDAVYELKDREQREAGCLLLGRVTYEEFAPHWPSMEEFARYNSLPRYVVSRTLDETDPTWPGEVLRSLDDVRRLKEGEGDPIYVHGSATLARSLAAEGLVDRYHLLVFPLLLGSGKRLFGEGGTQRLRLVESATYGNGVTLACYAVRR
ncbi:dihydrofolate reductase family protein [Ornithinimicrobium humiphilum]|uniref:RibD domain-containing protein n=1 Tax=Ornithinimicrobium humiphilum TaxID=125288 RepID=A0A543KLF8_9MICO|nr:dihydrofolate reductase family protein [Ornithinimicrobium humiphilum]TQM95925.1 RibD domain-containing protein [Ornithinimicrobium humiphilum]